MYENQQEETRNGPFKSTPKDLDKYRGCISRVEANLGKDEYTYGVKKITPEIFESKDKTRNAETFINNYKRTKATFIEQKKKQEGKISPNFRMPVEEELKEANMKAIDEDGLLESPCKKKQQEEEEEVIMQVDPETFQKKDHIFMQLFSLYGQNFIDQKRDEDLRG